MTWTWVDRSDVEPVQIGFTETGSHGSIDRRLSWMGRYGNIQLSSSLPFTLAASVVTASY
jgi:hypothetical protein